MPINKVYRFYIKAKKKGREIAGDFSVIATSHLEALFEINKILAFTFHYPDQYTIVGESQN